MVAIGRVDWDAYLPTLERLWALGRSCSQIAKEIPNATRSGIIGKVHRMGLAARASGGAAVSKPRRTGATRVQAAAVRNINNKPNGGAHAPHTAPLPWTPKADDFEPPIEQRKTFMQLTPRSCRYPFGDQLESGFYFCGGVTEGDRPYCSHHCRVAFEPMTLRARKSVQRLATIDNQGVKHHAY